MTRRILHLRTVTGPGGGPEKTILNSPRYIGEGYEMRLGYFRPIDDPLYDLPGRAASLGVNLVDIPESGALDFGALRRLSREIREFRPHLIHAHDYKTNVLSVVFGKLHRIPVVTTVHGYVTRTARLNRYYAVDRWSLRWMQHVVAVSDDIYDQVRAFGVKADRCTMVPNAIDAETYRRRQPRREAKQRLGISSDRLVVGAVGRLSAEKGFDLLIRAADRLITEGVPLELMIAGDGPERTNLEQVIATSANRDRLRLIGHCSEMIPFYEAMDVFALSSLREGLPNVLLEAMAMEIPTVATRIAGIPKVIDDSENGLLILPGDEMALADSLRSLLTNDWLREQLGANGRRCMIERFSFHKRMERIREVYDRVLGVLVPHPAKAESLPSSAELTVR
jgi:glycosyltransferase involved in cell wall biosynthesis